MTAATNGLLAQVPSKPDETSASKAFTQLPPNIAAAVAAYKAKGKGWTPDYKPGSEDEKIRAVFAAYATNDVPDDRDESQDPWKFEVSSGSGCSCHGGLTFSFAKIAQGLFRQSDEASHKLSPEEMVCRLSSGNPDCSLTSSHHSCRLVSACSTRLPTDGPNSRRPSRVSVDRRW